ncbi:hypothetical protein GPECTOR_804g31 [Gonium pectorale]|uniref:Uncharacterized protein n=1 Tax=Gonium pectorale TaxID=33097 RepID=A0A150FU46_GONPE|nr:hypothetical protein GPECTOR_804g31 [Gonium pectorale]|eukprot:KXZ41098.1 hypothetical protein GPECTOR_804g31 [Gonium pectorale]
MRKARAKMLYMPLWELRELLVCRRLLYSTVDEALAQELYRHYGGTVRHVLNCPQGVSKGEQLAELHEAMAGCNVEKMRNAMGSISTEPEASHRLLHIVADEHFELQYLKFASEWVADEFVKKALRDERQNLISLMSSTAGAANGMIYAPMMHSVLAQRGVKEEVLEFDPCTDTEFIKDWPVDAKPGVYGRPVSPTFPTVDAFKLGKDTLDFFQITVDTSKDLDAGKLSDVLSNVLPPRGVTPRLLFVVHGDRYRDFQLKATKDWPLIVRQQARYRLKLYIMRGEYAQ